MANNLTQLILPDEFAFRWDALGPIIIPTLKSLHVYLYNNFSLSLHCSDLEKSVNTMASVSTCDGYWLMRTRDNILGDIPRRFPKLDELCIKFQSDSSDFPSIFNFEILLPM